MSYDEEIAAYLGSRERIAELVRTLDDKELATTVPCCPKWTVKDLVGHVTGVLEDRGVARMPTGSFEDWTDAQVDRHRGEPLGSVLAAWFELPLDATDAPPSLQALALDAVTHEHDLFGALGKKGDPSTASVRVGAARALDRFANQLGEGDDAPSVEVTTEDVERRIGGKGAGAALATSHYELMRLVTGRMSEREARALQWDGDPSAALALLFADGFFRLQPYDVLDPAAG